MKQIKIHVNGLIPHQHFLGLFLRNFIKKISSQAVLRSGDAPSKSLYLPPPPNGKFKFFYKKII
jgi:hypothetical protein